MSSPAGAALQVGVDRQVELVSIVCRLAGYDEYMQARLDGYAKEVDGHFGRYARHPAVEIARRLRESAGLAFDGPMKLALLAPRNDADGPEDGTGRMPSGERVQALGLKLPVADVEAFLTALDGFRRDTGADGFFDAHETLYREVEVAYRQRFAQEIDLPWFARMFGPVGEGRFIVVPALLNGPANYGPSEQQAGRSHMYAILGVDAREGGYVSEGAAGSLVHEFAHAFANDWVDRNVERLDQVAGVVRRGGAADG